MMNGSLTAAAAHAGAEMGTEGDMAPGEASFVSWAHLGTFSGALIATVAIVQMLKDPLDQVWKIPTNWLAYAVALALLLAAQAFLPELGGFTAEKAALCAVNAVFVALSAMKAYNLAVETIAKQ